MESVCRTKQILAFRSTNFLCVCVFVCVGGGVDVVVLY